MCVCVSMSMRVSALLMCCVGALPGLARGRLPITPSRRAAASVYRVSGVLLVWMVFISGCLLWTVMGSPATSSETGKCPTAWMHGLRSLGCAGGLTHVRPVAEAVTKAPAPVLHALRYRCSWCGEADRSPRLSSGFSCCFLTGPVSRWQQQQQQQQLCSSGSSFNSPSSLCSVRASRCISRHCCNISPMSNRPPLLAAAHPLWA